MKTLEELSLEYNNALNQSSLPVMDINLERIKGRISAILEQEFEECSLKKDIEARMKTNNYLEI